MIKYIDRGHVRTAPGSAYVSEIIKDGKSYFACIDPLLVDGPNGEIVRMGEEQIVYLAQGLTLADLAEAHTSRHPRRWYISITRYFVDRIEHWAQRKRDGKTILFGVTKRPKREDKWPPERKSPPWPHHPT